MKSPSPTLNLTSFPEYYYGDSIPENEYEIEYGLPALNLGAESPWVSSTPGLSQSGARTLANDEEWAKLRAELQKHVPVPMPVRTRRGSSFSRRNKSWIDGDCGICFESAVRPVRTLCCGKVFCREHLTDWLDGSEADGRCPACKAPCTMAENTQSLSPKIQIQMHNDEVDSMPGIILSPVPVKPPRSSILFDESEAPASPISSGSASNSSNRSESLSPTVKFTSMRQRRSSSHLYDYFSSPFDPDSDAEDGVREPSPAPSDTGLYAPAVSLFVSPGTFVTVSRSMGRVLSLVGLLIVFYVVLS